MTKTLFKLKSLTDYLNGQSRPSAAHSVSKFGRMYTIIGDREQYIYVDAQEVKDILVPSLYRECSASVVQFNLSINDIKKF
jgi:hypothetical protein